MRFLLLISVFLSVIVPVFANSVNCPDSSENTKPIHFFLSKALQMQSLSSHQLSKNPAVALQNHRKAIEFLKSYMGCAEQNKLPIDAQIYYLKAFSHFEAKEFTESLKELDMALSIGAIPHKESLILKAKILHKKLNLKEASLLLESSISHYSEDSDILYYLGFINAELENYSKSILYLTSLYHSIQKKEGDTRYKTITLKFLGDVYYKRSDIAKAIYYYRLYLNQKENDTDVLYTIAQLYFISGNMKESRLYLQKILKYNPASKAVIQNLAEFYFIENKMNSLKFFEELSKEGKIKEDTILSGIHKLLLDRVPESFDFFIKFIEKNKNRLSARIALALIYQKQKKIPEYMNELKIISDISFSSKLYFLAIENLNELNEALEKNPSTEISHAENYNFLASCHEENGSPFLAVNSIKKAIELSKSDTEKNLYLIHLANLFRNPKINKFDESNKILSEINDPKNSTIPFLIGMNYFSLLKYKESISYITKAIELNPKNANFYFFRSTAYEKENLIPQVISDVRKAIDLDSTNPMYHNYIGYLYTENNLELSEAEKYIKQAVDIEPDNSAYQDSLGWVYFKMNKLREALHHLNLAEQIMLDKKEEDSTIYDHLGDVYLKSNEIEKAVSNWKKSLESQKSNPEKIKLQAKIKKHSNQKETN